MKIVVDTVWPKVVRKSIANYYDVLFSSLLTVKNDVAVEYIIRGLVRGKV